MHQENVVGASLPLCEFGAWRRTRGDLEVAIAAGPGIVALVGPGGSGKTSTMAAFALSSPDGRVKLRSPGQPVGADVTVDMVDGVDPAMAAKLDDEAPFAGTRVAAMLPETLAGVLAAHPDVRVVRMRPMEDADVRAMMEGRRVQLRLPPDIFTFKAMSNLSRLCEGNPRTLDRLFGGAAIAAGTGMSRRLSGEHVEESSRRMAATASGREVAGNSPAAPANGQAEPTAGLMHTGARLLPLPSQSDTPDAVPLLEVAEPAAMKPGLTAGEGGGSWDILRGGAGPATAATSARHGRPRRIAALAVLTTAAAAVAVCSQLPSMAPWNAVTIGTAETAWSTATGLFLRAPNSPMSAELAETGGNPDLRAVVGPPPRTSPLEPQTEASAEFGHGGSLRLPRAVDGLPPTIGLADSSPPADDPAILAAIASKAEATSANAVARPRDPANAARLLALGRVLESIGQPDDARAILTVSAEMGSGEASVAVAGFSLSE